MSKTSERKRGAIEFRQQLDGVLRVRWPRAFPFEARDVRPLANAAPEIAKALGWDPQYARGVVSAWTMRESYCRAVLCYPTRINLDGSPSELLVEDQARAAATKRLEEIAARKVREAEWRAKGSRAGGSRSSAAGARTRASNATRPDRSARARRAAPIAQGPHRQLGRKRGDAQARRRRDDHRSGDNDSTAAGAVARGRSCKS
jgi:hypothetical protein